MKSKKLPDTVSAYIQAMHDIMECDQQMKTDILENQLFSQDIYWKLFEGKAMLNYVDNDGDPALTPEQFKEVGLSAMKIAMEGSLQKMVNLGLLEEHEDGFKITQKGKDTFENNI